jgi:starch phosphorylase
VEGRVVFIEDYDLGVATQLIQGVDVWLNTPRHPWEACGTSGMKILVNGGLNLSQFDGWWAEAWNREVGWAIRPGATFEELSHTNDHDEQDVRELFDLLENQVIPAFYSVGQDGRPKEWIERIRASMNQLTASFSATRMVRQYVEDFYLPMRALGKQRGSETAHTLVQEAREIASHWPRMRFAGLNVHEKDDQQLYLVDVYLDGVSEQRVQVELVAEASEFGEREVHEMKMIQALEGSANAWTYECLVPPRPEGHYTPRVRIRDERLNLPLENPAILWLK